LWRQQQKQKPNRSPKRAARASSQPLAAAVSTMPIPDFFLRIANKKEHTGLSGAIFRYALVFFVITNVLLWLILSAFEVRIPGSLLTGLIFLLVAAAVYMFVYLLVRQFKHKQPNSMGGG
jgi:hypothetical protein